MANLWQNRIKKRSQTASATRNPLFSFGWETWIRTTIHGVRVRCPAVERSPKSLCPFGFAYNKNRLYSQQQNVYSTLTGYNCLNGDAWSGRGEDDRGRKAPEQKADNLHSPGSAFQKHEGNPHRVSYKPTWDRNSNSTIPRKSRISESQ